MSRGSAVADVVAALRIVGVVLVLVLVLVLVRLGDFIPVCCGEERNVEAIIDGGGGANWIVRVRDGVWRDGEVCEFELDAAALGPMPPAAFWAR